jgi:hypothetical protein
MVGDFWKFGGASRHSNDSELRILARQPIERFREQTSTEALPGAGTALNLRDASNEVVLLGQEWVLGANATQQRIRAED